MEVGAQNVQALTWAKQKWQQRAAYQAQQSKMHGPNHLMSPNRHRHWAV
jgi:hypothetical protein